jgi:hypothetical protein
MVRDQVSKPHKKSAKIFSQNKELIYKSKAVLLHAMEADWGRGGTAPTHT